MKQTVSFHCPTSGIEAMEVKRERSSSSKELWIDSIHVLFLYFVFGPALRTVENSSN